MEQNTPQTKEKIERSRDFVYTLLPNGITSGKIKTIRQVLKIITRATLAYDLHMDKKTLDQRLSDPSKWTVGELTRMTELFGVPLRYVIELVLGRPIADH